MYSIERFLPNKSDKCPHSDNYKESGSSETLDAEFAGQLLLYSASTKDSTGTGQDRQ